MSNKYTEKFARLSPEGQAREQSEELQRLESGEMSESEWFERASAWREIGRPDFDETDALEMWERARPRETEKSKRKTMGANMTKTAAMNKRQQLTREEMKEAIAEGVHRAFWDMRLRNFFDTPRNAILNTNATLGAVRRLLWGHVN